MDPFRLFSSSGINAALLYTSNKPLKAISNHTYPWPISQKFSTLLQSYGCIALLQIWLALVMLLYYIIRHHYNKDMIGKHVQSEILVIRRFLTRLG
jgi:hypothetical protein